MDILGQLRDFGLRLGEWLAVFGDVAVEENEARGATEFERVSEALAAAVGPEGCLLVPTFTAGREFDPANTPAAGAKQCGGS